MCGWCGSAPSTARPAFLIVADLSVFDADDPTGSGTARLHWATGRAPVDLTRSAAQRLACDATLRVVVTDGHEVLGVTVAHPTVSATLRAALIVRMVGVGSRLCPARRGVRRAPSAAGRGGRADHCGEPDSALVCLADSRSRQPQEMMMNGQAAIFFLLVPTGSAWLGNLFAFPYLLTAPGVVAGLIAAKRSEQAGRRDELAVLSVALGCLGVVVDVAMSMA